MDKQKPPLTGSKLIKSLWMRMEKQAIDMQAKIGMSPIQVANLFFGIATSVALAALPGSEVAKIMRMYADELEESASEIPESGSDCVH